MTQSIAENTNNQAQQLASNQATASTPAANVVAEENVSQVAVDGAVVPSVADALATAENAKLGEGQQSLGSVPETTTGLTQTANEGAVQTASTAEPAAEATIQAEEVGIDVGSTVWIGGAGLALAAGLLAAAGGSGGHGHATEASSAATATDSSTAASTSTVSTDTTVVPTTATDSTVTNTEVSNTAGGATTAVTSTSQSESTAVSTDTAVASATDTVSTATTTESSNSTITDTSTNQTAVVSAPNTDSAVTSTEANTSTATDASTNQTASTTQTGAVAVAATEAASSATNTAVTDSTSSAASSVDKEDTTTTNTTVANSSSSAATDANAADTNNTAIASASDLGSASAVSSTTAATIDTTAGSDTAADSSVASPTTIGNTADTAATSTADATATSSTTEAATTTSSNSSTAASGTTEVADSTTSSASAASSVVAPVADTSSSSPTVESSTVADSASTATSSASSAAGTAGSLTDTSTSASATAASAKEAGLTLDIAKHFYSVDAIKDYIDTLSKAGGTFLQLHLSDDTNYALESTVLNQLKTNAVLNSDGSYTNPLTGQQFLSTDQVSELTTYAKQKGIELVPEVDTPSHMNGIFTLLEAAKGSAFVSSIKSSVVSDEINITSNTAISWVKSLLGEVVGMFGSSSQHLHIGGDEFGYSVSNNNEFVSYVNTLSKYLTEQGITARVWNDGLLKSNLAGLDHSVQVTYWSYDGNPMDSSVADDRREIRASMGDLLDDGFKVLNYNWYYLYSVPEQGVSSEDSAAHMASDIQTKWNLGVWDGTNTTTQISDTSNIIGSSMTIWGENASGLTEDQILNWNSHAISALVSKTNAGSIDVSSLPLSTVTLNAETAVNQKVSFTYQSGDHIQVSASKEFLASGNAFVWLDGDVGDVLSLGSGWAASGASAVQDGNSYTLYRNGLNHVYVDTDINVQIAVV